MYNTLKHLIVGFNALVLILASACSKEQMVQQSNLKAKVASSNQPVIPDSNGVGFGHNMVANAIIEDLSSKYDSTSFNQLSDSQLGNAIVESAKQYGLKNGLDTSQIGAILRGNIASIQGETFQSEVDSYVQANYPVEYYSFFLRVVNINYEFGEKAEIMDSLAKIHNDIILSNLSAALKSDLIDNLALSEASSVLWSKDSFDSTGINHGYPTVTRSRWCKRVSRKIKRWYYSKHWTARACRADVNAYGKYGKIPFGIGTVITAGSSVCAMF